jgi:hypothetical protein
LVCSADTRRLSDAPLRQRPVAIKSRTRGQNLLDSALASWTNCGIAKGSILGAECSMSFVVEFLHFLKARKNYWLWPVLLIMLVFGGLVVFTQGSALAPFIYTLF